MEARGLMRRLVIAALGTLLWWPAAAAAEPVRDTPSTLTSVLAGSSAVLHYTTAAGDPDAIAAARAQELVTQLDEATARFRSLGYPFLNDGDGKVDAFVFYKAGSTATGTTIRDNKTSSATTSTAWIRLSPNAARGTPGHELFHVVNFGLDAKSPRWVLEGGATWAGTLFTGQGRSALTPSGISLNCAPINGVICTGDEDGYGRWPFFASLAQDQGGGFLRDVFERLRALGSGTPRFVPVLQELLQPRGTDLTATYLRSVERLVANTLAGAPRISKLPVAAVDQLDTGNQAGAIVQHSVSIDHLSTYYIGLAPAAAPAEPCRDMQLLVAVTVPAGVATRPMVDRIDDSAGPLTIAVPAEGGSGAVTLPWSNCPPAAAVIALPNGTVATDDQPFSIATRLDQAPGPAVEPDTTPPALSEVIAIGRQLTGTASEAGRLSIRVRRPGQAQIPLIRDVAAGPFTIRLPKVVLVKGKTKLALVIGDAAGNLAPPIAVRVRK